MLLWFLAIAESALAAPDLFGALLDDQVYDHNIFAWTSLLVGLSIALLGLAVSVYGGQGSYLSFYANGFISISTICSVIAWNAEPWYGYSQRIAIYLLVFFATGFAGGLLFGFAPFAGHVLSNAFYGLCLGLEFLCLKSGGLFESIIGRILFLIPFSLTPAILSYFHPKIVLGVLSGLSGPFILLMGVDWFLQTGLFIAVASFLTLSESGAAEAEEYVFDTMKQISVASSFFLGLVVALFQYRYALRTFGIKPRNGD